MYFKVSVLCHAHNDCRDLQEQLDRQNYIIYGTNDNLKTQMRSFQDKEEWCIGVRTKGEVIGGGTEKTENENEKEREIIIATHPLGVFIQAPTACFQKGPVKEGAHCPLPTQMNKSRKPAHCPSHVGPSPTGGPLTCIPVYRNLLLQPRK